MDRVFGLGAVGIVTLLLSTGCGASPSPPRAPQGAGTGPCSSDAECGAGRMCCYPCGIEGCENVCMDVNPAHGCPEIP